MFATKVVFDNCSLLCAFNALLAQRTVLHYDRCHCLLLVLNAQFGLEFAIARRGKALHCQVGYDLLSFLPVKSLRIGNISVYAAFHAD